METCPHGARITVEDGRPVVFLEPCDTCQVLLSELPTCASVPVHREFVRI
jgi:hypothetical protein